MGFVTDQFLSIYSFREHLTKAFFCDMLDSGIELLNRCIQLKNLSIYPTHPTLQVKRCYIKKIERFKIKCVPNDSLCSNKESKYLQHMFILSMSGGTCIFMSR